MARTRNADASRATILAVARNLFGERGFERTTVRAVASEAEVDPALVMHYFGTKRDLFTAAARLDIQLPDLTDTPVDEVADALVPVFTRLWGPDGPLLPLLRAASTNPEAAAILRALFTEQIAPSLGAVACDDRPERGALIGAQLLGIAVSRFIVGLPALQDIDESGLVHWLRPVIAHYLTSPAVNDVPQAPNGQH